MFKNLKIKIKIGAKFCHLVTPKKRGASNCTQTMFFGKCSPKLAIFQWEKRKKVEITNLDHNFFHVVNIWQGLNFLKTFL